LQLIIPDTRVPNKWNEEWPDINKEQGSSGGALKPADQQLGIRALVILCQLIIPDTRVPYHWNDQHGFQKAVQMMEYGVMMEQVSI
jgi:hypothetical protein